MREAPGMTEKVFTQAWIEVIPGDGKGWQRFGGVYRSGVTGEAEAKAVKAFAKTKVEREKMAERLGGEFAKFWNGAQYRVVRRVGKDGPIEVVK
jgi:hypothetical protein